MVSTGGMMMKIVNEPFHLLTIGGVKIHAKALAMTPAMQWAKQANSAQQAIQDATDYEAMADAIAAGVECLRDYPDITSGLKNDVPAEVWDEISTEQVTGALDALLEVNDPFVSVRRKRAEAEEKGVRMLAMLPESERGKMMTQLLQMQSAQSPANSGLTHGQSSTAGHGDSGSKPATV